jgi:hypothetical protein
MDRGLTYREVFLKIREASFIDRENWKRFVDTQNGSFHHYYDWKFPIENKTTQFIPLMVESETSELLGIWPITKNKHFLYSKMDSIAGPLFKRDLTDSVKNSLLQAVLEYIESKYAENCSRFWLRIPNQWPPVDGIVPNPVLLEHGFQLTFDPETQMPVKHMLELKQPFEKNIWMGLLSSKFRQELRLVEKNGVSVVEDTELRYLDTYVDMLTFNYKRHRIEIPSRKILTQQMQMQVQTFKGKIKFFVAMFENKPIAILYCSYTPSICQLEGIGTYSKDTQDANKLCYKTAIEQACNAGYRFVDFGSSETASLARLKERFGFTRLPILQYEKRYSRARTLIEFSPVMVGELWRKRTQIWTNRRHYWKTVTRC